MNNLDKQYQDLLKDILINGVTKSDRTGTGTISVFGRQIRHKMSDGFPLLTTKRVHFKSVVTELLWFLRGDTNIKYLVDNDCNIWNGDAWANYQRKIIEKFNDNSMISGHAITSVERFIEKIKSDNEFAKEYGELGPIYGKQWRNWNGEYELGSGESKYDQIQNLINDLKTNPDSRRLMVNAWNVGELDQMVLPPCHFSFQVYTRELSWEERCKIVTGKDLPFDKLNNSDKYKIDYMYEHNIPTRAISLMWNQRSVDTFLGLPFNIASYGLLLRMIADEVNMIPDELIGNLGDTHLYLNHIDPAKEQLTRDSYDLPSVFVRDGIHSYMPGDVVLQDYKSHPTIKAPLSN
jgi:thymidylate synthase